MITFTSNIYIGVVEDRIDPEKLGRCKVRFFGIHTEDKKLLPTSDLPWSHTILPITNTGNNVYPPKEGSWVAGTFLDGKTAQNPILIGILPGIPENFADGKFGFNDPREEDETLTNSPKKIASKTYKDDGSGIDITEDDSKTYPQILKESDSNRLQRNENITETIVQEKKDNRLENIKIAEFNSACNNIWNEPENPYNSSYPYNNSFVTESGHVLEFDDTQGNERIHLWHRTGTFDEIHPTGDKVTKIVGNDYEIVLKDKDLYVSGKLNINIQGDSTVYCQGNMTAQIDGNGKIYNKGTFDILSEDDITIKSNANMKLEAERIDIN